MTKKVLLFYPPGDMYQRGEDRSQGNVSDSAATVMRAPNDMGYAASSLLEKGFEVRFKDYQTEELSIEDLEADFRAFNPDVILTSITNSTIHIDLKVVRQLKEINKDLIVVLKGALFFDVQLKVLDELDLSDVNYLIGGELEFIAANLIKAHYDGPDEIKGIHGLLYLENGKWTKTAFSSWNQNLDDLPFPQRSMINNTLYVRPDV
ncbi:MAG: cobalamin B12-binding domain-containing protein, partial [Rhodospirillales bacterium]|nr:cobalamin B12-binding domain-containing protein [Rhodospirillales bacterium]